MGRGGTDSKAHREKTNAKHKLLLYAHRHRAYIERELWLKGKGFTP